MNNRLARVREVMKREIGVAIERNLVFDGGLVTVNDVDVTPDLRHCDVFISVLGTDHQQQSALRLIEGNRALLQNQVAKRVILKFTPRFHFKLDSSVAEGSRIIALLDSIGAPAEKLDASFPDERVADEDSDF